MSQNELNQMLYGRQPQSNQDTVDIPRETVAELEKLYNGEVEAHKTSLARLESERVELRKQGYSEKAIAEKVKELEAMIEVHAVYSEKFKQRLETKRAYEDLQARALHAEQVKKSDEERTRYHEAARLAWLQNGGNPDTFEAKFPELWDAELVRRMNQSGPSQEHAQQVRRMFY